MEQPSSISGVNPLQNYQRLSSDEKTGFQSTATLPFHGKKVGTSEKVLQAQLDANAQLTFQKLFAQDNLPHEIADKKLEPSVSQLANGKFSSPHQNLIRQMQELLDAKLNGFVTPDMKSILHPRDY